MPRTISVRVGSISAGQLAAGQRASSTNVGYLGSDGALTVYNPGGTPPAGWAWDGNTLVTTTANATLNLARVNGGVVGLHTSPIITNCKVVAPAGEIFCVSLNGTGKGTLTVTDTTIVGSLGGVDPQTDGLSSDSILVARRVHLTLSGDGVHLVSNGSLISQVYVGPLRFSDEGQHCDGMQQFQDTVNGSFTVEHCYVENTASTIGTPYNSALTMGPPTATGPTYTPTLNNNYFGGGLYHLRFNHQCRSAVVTNNDFGPIHSGEFGYHDWSSATGNTYTTWTGNRDEASNIIAAP